MIIAKQFKKILSAVFLAIALVSLSACASINPNEAEQSSVMTAQQTAAQEAAARQARIEAGDPFEKMNRSIHKFNFTLDRIILKPISKAYVEYIPKPVRSGVGHFFSNLWEPNTMLNALLQGKGMDAANSTGRFLLNSTMGVLGVFDVASPLGLPQKKEDFGQTLAVWGVGDGAYLVLPFFGPSNIRDLGGLIAQTLSTDLVPPLFDGSEQWAAAGLRVIDTRVGLLGAEETLALQVDPYLFLRESYRQARLLDIHDGVLPEAEEDPFEAGLFE